MSKSEVAIIGAGIQGVCNALFLQKKGIDVTLFAVSYTSTSPRD